MRRHPYRGVSPNERAPGTLVVACGRPGIVVSSWKKSVAWGGVWIDFTAGFLGPCCYDSKHVRLPLRGEHTLLSSIRAAAAMARRP